MPAEIEIKLPIVDLAGAVSKLQVLGCSIAKPRHFEDNLLLDDLNQTLRNQQSIMRVRTTVEIGSNTLHTILTLKEKPAIVEGAKQREEIECEVDSKDNLIRILTALGFSPLFRYQKFRTVYQIQGISFHFCVDETPIGNFYELEGEIGHIHHFAKELGYTKEQYISQSYAALYFQHCSERGIKPSHMIFQPSK